MFIISFLFYVLYKFYSLSKSMRSFCLVFLPNNNYIKRCRSFCYLLLMVFLALFVQISYGTQYDCSDFEDWAPRISWTKRTDFLCFRCYKQRSFIYPLDSDTEYPTTITSDEVMVVSEGTSSFYGNVTFNKGNQQIVSDKIFVEHDKEFGGLKTLHADGNVKMTEPGLVIIGSKASVFYLEKRKVIYNSSYRLYEEHARGQSDYINIDDVHHCMLLKNASYTTCALGNNAWQLKAKKTKFDKRSGRGEAWHSWLYMKGYHVFYFPYMNFSIDKRRKTGFLHPSIQTSSMNGTTLIFPFVWNIAQNYDMTITTHFMRNRRLKVDNLFYYMKQNNRTQLQFNFFIGEKKHQYFSKECVSENLVRNIDPQIRRFRDYQKCYGIFFEHVTEYNKQLKLSLRYTNITNNNYLYGFQKAPEIFKKKFVPLDSGDASDVLMLTNPELEVSVLNRHQQNTSTACTALQLAELEHRGFHGTLKFKVEQYKSLFPLYVSASQNYRKLPEISWQSKTFDLFTLFNWNIIGTYTGFNSKNIICNERLTDGHRFHFRPSLTFPLNAPAWYINPRIQWDVVLFKNLQLGKTDSSAKKPSHSSHSIPILDNNVGLMCERTLSIFNIPYLQTLEPRLYYLYVPYHDQSQSPIFDSCVQNCDYNQLYRDNRYCSYDRIGDANQITFGLQSRFFLSETGEEKASVSVGKILYFRDRVSHVPGGTIVNNRWSPYAITGYYRIYPNLDLQWQWVGKHVNKTQSGSIQLQYLLDSTYLVNVLYQFNRSSEFDDIVRKTFRMRQLHVAFALKFQFPTRLLGVVDYDFNLRRVVNVMLNLEHHGCCTITKIALARTIKVGEKSHINRYDNAIRFEFILKGLTSNVT